MSLAYNDVDYGVYFGGTGLQTDVLSQLTNKATYGDADNVTFWNAMADVTLQKNVYLHAEYAFDVDTEASSTDARMRGTFPELQVLILGDTRDRTNEKDLERGLFVCV